MDAHGAVLQNCFGTLNQVKFSTGMRNPQKKHGRNFSGAE